MKLRTLFQNALLGSCLVVGLAGLGVIACASRNIYNQVLSSDAKKTTLLNEAKRTELQSLVEDVLKKAEFKDGRKGISLEDMADMAPRLGYTKRIYEGDNLFLNVDGPWGVIPPKLGLRIVKSYGDYAYGMKIDEQKIRDYVGSP
ncbi:MAG: hypothetical protein AABX17_01215 [Nanoarchaeota archaeon]